MGIETVTLKKIVPLGLMFFCILFNYTILRDTKDVLVVTAKGSSAEIIPFLKTWVNLPMAIGFMLLYSQLSNVLSKQALFYTVMVPFIAFFGAFGFLLYPLSGYFHPTALADKLLATLGPRFLGPLAILRIWSFCLFYVMAELWGSVVVSVLFWGFANQMLYCLVMLCCYADALHVMKNHLGCPNTFSVCFYGHRLKCSKGQADLDLKGNLCFESFVFTWLWGTLTSCKKFMARKNLGPGVDGWALSLKGMMSIVVLMGLIICALYWWVNTYVPLPTRSKKKKFPSPNEYSSFMGDFSTATGIATFTMMLLSQWIFNKYGWGVAATVTPTVLLLTGVGFFSLLLFGGPLTPALMSFGITPLLAAVYVGAIQNIFSKSAKYSLFDPCKEMAYIPLDEDTKVKGKAAIDVVCNPLGKSGGALIQQFMILTFGSLANSTPYLGGVLLVIVIAWLAAARSLDKQFTALRREEELEKEMEESTLKIPVISETESGNGTIGGGPELKPIGGGDSTGVSS
ncbi:hypothetical protein AG4045_023677 [Apium graveolens]|uniref:ADP,ATP carrier protein n=1 Tax=Apium graveolens TaxID=4045 RepID=A0A6L5BAP3_APIGR|nr:hypothetical protein AG4045_023677 [Apium graveolens]